MTTQPRSSHHETTHDAEQPHAPQDRTGRHRRRNLDAQQAHTGLVARHPLASFVVLAYAISWLTISPWVLSHSGLGIIDVHLDKRLVGLFLLLGTFGPMMAALVVQRLAGRPVAPVMRRLGRLPRRPLAWLVVLVLVPLAEALGLALLAGRGAALMPVPAAVVMGLAGAISGPLGEEPGWRGFALPLLQRRMAPVPAALVLGLVWAGWHLPQFLTAEWDTPHRTAADVLAFVGFCVAGAVVLAWAVNLGRGSVLVAVLGHTLLNATPVVANAISGWSLHSMWPITVGMAGLAVVAAAVSGGRLGLQGSSDDTAREAQTRPR